MPNYIKLDVDGIEHLILEGGDKYLKNKNIKGLCIEINENFKTQYKKVISILKKNNFRILHKKHSKEFDLKINKFNKTFNYIFIR